jgi:HEAT repeat protein
MHARTVASLLLVALVLPPAWGAADADADVRALVKQLKDKDEFVRLKAAKSLGKLGTAAKGALPALTEALEDPDEDVRAVAKQAIAKIKEAAAGGGRAGGQLAELLKRLKDKSPAARQKACEAIGALGAAGAEGSEALILALGDRSPAVQQAALDALEKVNPTLHRPVLTLLVDRNDGAKVEAMRQIGRMRADGKPAVPLLVRYCGMTGVPAAHLFRLRAFEALKEIDPGGREYALLLLQAIPVSRAVPAGLEGTLVRRKAIGFAMELVRDKRLGAAQLVRPLVVAMNDPACRIQAIDALGELGAAAREAVPVLTALKRDPDMATRDAAAAALKKIQ